MRVRVGNTDAEGRMAMADPLHHTAMQVCVVFFDLGLAKRDMENNPSALEISHLRSVICNENVTRIS